MKIQVTEKLPENAVVISAGALIFDTSGNCVFEKRTKDCPYSPNGLEVFGGMVEKEESPLECLHRELLEETKLDFKKQDISPILIGYQESLNDANKFNARYIIRNLDTSEMQVSKESAGAETFSSFNEAIEQKSHPLGFSVQGYVKLLQKELFLV